MTKIFLDTGLGLSKKENKIDFVENLVNKKTGEKTEKVKFVLRLFHEVIFFYLTLLCCQKGAVEGAFNQAVGTGASFILNLI